MICWAFCFAADMASGDMLCEEKNERAMFRSGAKIEEAMVAVLWWYRVTMERRRAGLVDEVEICTQGCGARERR